MRIDPVQGRSVTDVSSMMMPASWRRVRFTLRYTLELAEDARRRTAGVGAVVDVGLLSTVLSLPESMIGPLDVATSTTLPALLGSTLVQAVRDVDGSLWGNQVGHTPLAPLEAVVTARSLRAGLGSADALGGYVPRSVLVPRSAQMPAELVAEAELYGIGVRRGESVGDNEVVVECGALRVDRVTPEWWEFCEAMYGTHLALRGSARAHRSSLNQLSTSAGGFSFGF